MRKSKGKMQGTRNIRKGHRERGMLPVNQYMQVFEKGDRVHIDVVPSEPSGMPFPRFRGKTGVVRGKQGNAYKVEITDGKSTKLLIVNSVHPKRA